MAGRSINLPAIAIFAPAGARLREVPDVHYKEP